MRGWANAGAELSMEQGMTRREWVYQTQVET